MRNATRLAFTALAAQIALLNGVASATEKFNVAPSVQQTLETAMQECPGHRIPAFTCFRISRHWPRQPMQSPPAHRNRCSGGQIMKCPSSRS